MPKGVVGAVSKGKGVVRRLDVGTSEPSEPSTSSGITHGKAKKDSFKSLLGKYQGLSNLTPRKLKALVIVRVKL